MSRSRSISLIVAIMVLAELTACRTIDARMDKKDGDNDALPDAWERLHGLDLRRDEGDDDPDGDGVTNFDEMVYGTNPTNPDTDGDGYSDGAEISIGAYPTVATDHPPGPPDRPSAR